MSMTIGPVGAPGCSRRQFVIAAAAAAAAPGALAGWFDRDPFAGESRIVPRGPGAKYVPRIFAAAVRRKGEYGLRWPGAVYDGAAALKDYTAKLRAAEKDLGLKVELRPEPIHSAAEADAWLAEAKDARPDGLFVLVMDRQEHAWPTASKAIASGIPTVVFAPVGTAFTTNTEKPGQQPGGFLCSTSDFEQARYGLRMLRAAAKLREMRFIVLRGAARTETRLPHFGTNIRHLPAASFLDEYRRTPVSDEIRRMARNYLRAATRVRGGATEEDVVNGIKSYAVARAILEREEGDGISMDCLGALGSTNVSLPCISWSKMLDQGIPAACEADLGACVTHALVQQLFDRPGFQQDPVPETARQCLIGAHCSCPTRLAGFDRPAEPFDIRHHHGNRDAVPHPVWRTGQRMTVCDVLLEGKADPAKPDVQPPPQLVIATGTVTDNVAVPPAGGCVVSVMVKLDRETDLLSFPGFHQLFLYGDFGRELEAYCRLTGVEAVRV